MKNNQILSTTQAGNIFLMILGGLLIFHCMILLGILPKSIVWAGKINDDATLIRMELISILVLVLYAVIVCMKLGYLQLTSNRLVINGGVWLLFGLCALNTLGNTFAESPIEKYGFGALTLLMAILALLMALDT